MAVVNDESVQPVEDRVATPHPTYLPGQRVRVRVPENPRVNLTVGTIYWAADWGCHLNLASAATGRFRALWEEMEPVGEGDCDVQPMVTQAYVGHHPELDNTVGSPCDRCGSMRVRRIGPCVRCDDCGENGGCG